MEVMQVNDTHLWKTGSKEEVLTVTLQTEGWCSSVFGYQEKCSRDEDLCEENRN